MNTDNIQFEGFKSEFVKETFLQAYASFPTLHSHPITVRRIPLTRSTMRAQPIINLQFWNKQKRHYRIDVSNHTELEHHVPIPDLPRDVLVGWFAHELGHVIDYQNRSAFGMIRFGIGYLLMPTFRIGVERQADIYAIDRGFAEYLLATKTYILEQSSLPNHYKRRIQKYYMSPDEIALLLNREESDDLKMDKIL